MPIALGLYSLKGLHVSLVDRPPIHLSASAGAPLVIALEATPGAALIWSAPEAPDGCTLIRKDSVPEGSGIGGPVQQRFLLTCTTAGKWQLRFELRRPWEDVVRAVQEIHVDVP